MESEMEEFECQEESEEQKEDSSQEDEKESSKDVSFLQISRGNDWEENERIGEEVSTMWLFSERLEETSVSVDKEELEEEEEQFKTNWIFFKWSFDKEEWLEQLNEHKSITSFLFWCIRMMKINAAKI